MVNVYFTIAWGDATWEITDVYIARTQKKPLAFAQILKDQESSA